MSSTSKQTSARGAAAGKSQSSKTETRNFRKTVLSMLFPGALVLGAALLFQSRQNARPGVVCDAGIPAQAQIIDQRSFNALSTVPPPSVANGSQVFRPPGIEEGALRSKPFHVYDPEFLSIIGCDPTLTVIARSEEDPLFHEAVVWFPPTDEVFFVQNAGAKAAGTGMAKSAIIQKISLSEAQAVSSTSDTAGEVVVTTVDSAPTVMNPNGGTNYKGNIIFAAEGQGEAIPSALYLMNPYPPYNTTVLLNNFFGRQFNSINDVAVHPRNKEIYFTDSLYGFLQDFRPAPGIQNQVYRFNEATGAVSVIADGFGIPNGLTFSPDGSYAYVTDTGTNLGFYGRNYSSPAAIYRFDVRDDGTWENRKVFAFIASGVPDGVHCDADGNLYAGCGDGVQVFSPSGKLLGKIYLGATAANFQFAGDGRMVICAETELYYATLGASGAPIDERV
ncbi:Lactonohydrolase [Pleurostoma richardsiae]|uniref:Lactonohydrolase n=1 Tax=Pleurostoma richardsiae TaxID=41990 RepID=A0AA38RRX1_9PEZI|nr:Lactonohydrolase [Pleurostoma richardsiae]